MLFPSPEKSGPPPRVVITGAGIVTSLGLGWDNNAEGFRTGRVAMNAISLFDVSRQRVKSGGEVQLPKSLPATGLSSRQESRLDRATKLLLLAAHEAWRQSGWQPSCDLPLVLGTTSGGMGLGENYYRQALNTPRNHRGQPSRVIQYQAQTQALSLTDAFGFSGPVTIIANACASGSNAIGHAWELLRAGHSQRVLTGGFDALSQLVFAGFDSLQALSTTQCRPFDANRDGLALGEGAGILTLETLDHAQNRGASILGEIVGYGSALDVHHLTQPHPEGNAALASMNAASHMANLSPSNIHYVNAHGTGTPLNDGAEAHAIRRWAGERAATLPVSSTKSGIGHLLGAAGAVEAIICLMALKGQWLPPTSTLQIPDTVCKFPIVREPGTARLEYVLSNSFGFGGANATLIFRRWS
ncbi:beta-ketoacyl-[acyl-carrier-protein] synthase family protein [Pedosphaera parvula]|uniref:Beta-ketoacyl synthase n=1 Tax=Pedosphaera parvula (strain Ellin514) TaxID=320771 RepID=B9XGA3_PEDPL|nr:beta-ketoacyl-[acyl-carrier-protein] synthase family protein [Pedosphaera parvula]EEF61265.1 Beta-ketoacyl synthase [Pedosphaera parvula Ellin514]